MHDEATFLQAMQEQPEDNALRLVFADWLEERGDPRGELLRLLHTLTKEVETPQRQELEGRLRSLLGAGVQTVGPFWMNSIGIKFAWVTPGTFRMGSPKKDKWRCDDETQHWVTLSKGFYLAIHPVTQASWQEVMGNNRSHFHDGYLPVVQVSWDDCQEFLQKLSKQDGHAYRLPTEAEWEYACRGATTTPFFYGETISTDQANFNGHNRVSNPEGLHRGKTTPVGSFSPNAWGLNDMHGNVCEWCADWYEVCPEWLDYVVDPQGPESGPGRVYRGGSFECPPFMLRSASRLWSRQMNHMNNVGFRAARFLG